MVSQMSTVDIVNCKQDHVDIVNGELGWVGDGCFVEAVAVVLDSEKSRKNFKGGDGWWTPSKEYKQKLLCS